MSIKRLTPVRSERCGVRDADGGLATQLTVEFIESQGLKLAIVECPTNAAGAKSERLTRAELAVVGLALEGLSNRAIAARRGCSYRTVANQLASIFAKLDIGSRAELAAWAARVEE